MTDLGMSETRSRLLRLERRDWGLWLTAVMVMLLLVGAVYSLTLTPAWGGGEPLNHPQLDIAVWALLGMVLLFGVFAVHQQVRIARLRRQLSAQIGMLSALETRAEVFQKLAILDPLTGLYNRRFATEHLPIEIARSERHGYPLTLVMLDLNALKQINDTHGHAAGDLVLMNFARLLKKAVRSSDLPVRMGGDEFLVVLPECRCAEVPAALARMTGMEVDINGEKIRVGFAAGWAEYRAGESVEALLERADRALYEDKRTGGAEDQAKQAKALIQQAHKMEVVGRLAGGVAHDFNNLLTVIRGYSELVLEEFGSLEALREKVQEIHKAAERAASLTRQLLAFSRKQVIEAKELDLNAVLREMEMMLQRLIGDKVEVVSDLAADLGTVRADPGQIEQIIMNLAVNARDAMPNGGRITITTANFVMDQAFVAAHTGARAGEYVSLALSDNGIGMDAHTQAHIFEPFFTTKEKGKGTGLGLSIVYGIVKQNGGYIWVDSEPGRGTSLTIYFPRLPQAAEEAASQPRVASQAAAVGKRQAVMVVECVDALRNFMAELLHESGYHVLPAASSEEAVKLSSEYADAIQAMVADVVMNGMSGLDLTECLRLRRPDLKVLFISGYPGHTALYQGAVDKSTAFLQTPFTQKELANKLRELLRPAEELAAPVATRN